MLWRGSMADDRDGAAVRRGLDGLDGLARWGGRYLSSVCSLHVCKIARLFHEAVAASASSESAGDSSSKPGPHAYGMSPA